MKSFEKLSDQQKATVVEFARRLNLPSAVEWYEIRLRVLDGGPGKSLELSDYFWTELFEEVEDMHAVESWKTSLRAALYGDAEGMVDYKEWVKALQDAASIAGVSFKEVLDAYYE